MSIFILFQDAGLTQPWAGFLVLLTVILGSLNAYQLYKSREAGTWRGAANAYEAELKIVRARAERLTEENKELNRQVTELQARTDLSQLARDSTEQHAGIVIALRELSESSARHHAQVSQLMTEQVKMFMGLQSHTASAFEQVAEQFRTIKAELDRR
jgi:hypothetical protein